MGTSVNRPNSPPGRTPGSPTAKREWRADWANVPQLRGEKLRNGATWCGPAVGTTLARMLGTHTDKENHELFHELRGKHTTSEGTTPKQMLGMIRDVGGRVDGQIIAGGYTNAELDGIFKKDNKVVAQIGVKDPKTGEYGSHWVMVSEKGADGRFTVKDPLRGELQMTPQQLREAVYRTPGLGGVLIPVTHAEGGAPRSTGHSLEDSFVEHTRPSSTGGTGPSLPAGASSQQLVKQVVGQLGSDNLQKKMAGQRQLETLERSSSSVARQAYEAIMRLFARSPGGGQRSGHSGYD